MALKPNEIGRLTLQEICEYRYYSGITERQYQILKRKFYDKDEPSMQQICLELNISIPTYNREMKKAFKTINKNKTNQDK